MGILDALTGNSARRHYRDRGYHVFRAAFASESIAAIGDMAHRLIPAHRGELRRQDGTFAPNDFFPGTTFVRNSLLHPHLHLPGELQELSLALRTLLTSDELAQRLRSLDGVKHYIVHQSLLFFSAQTTELHLDSWSLDTAPLGHTHTVWIPLQDMDHKSGVPCVLPWPTGNVMTERQLGLEPGAETSRDERYTHYHQALREKLLAGSPEIATTLMRKGDFMVWSSLTPHFTLPSYPFPTERLSLQVLIRPADMRWGDFLEQPYDRTSVQLEKISESFSIRPVT